MRLNLSYAEALCLAQEHEMEKDSNVFIFGLDVGDHKCSFNSTKGLKSKFGDARVFSTPLSEDANMGIAIGAAISGLRPINIHIRADFLLLCMNQLGNIAGNVRYYSQGRLSCPLVVRAIIGKGWGQGAQHSKEIYPLFKYLPGIKIILPASPQEAYSGLKAGIQSNDPVICFEPRYFYNKKEEVDTEKEISLDHWKHLWCEYPPCPTTRPLEKEYYKTRFGVDGDDMEWFTGPF
jgi:acetoin:2,6-dichlorophenolindophenol oxidoreductase subunit beta